MLKAAWKLAEIQCPALKELRKATKALAKKSLRTSAIRSTLSKHGKSIQRD